MLGFDESLKSTIVYLSLTVRRWSTVGGYEDDDDYVDDDDDDDVL